VVTSNNLFDELLRIILLPDPAEKCSATRNLQSSGAVNIIPQMPPGTPYTIAKAGLPGQLKLVPPRQLKKRSIQQQQGRNVLMHAIAHKQTDAVVHNTQEY
jgi:uncharacterized ferritin-like protein (DUF455 family)